MLDELTTYVGGAAAFLASLSYIPQVRKAWPRGETKDLSLSMLVTLTLGLSLGLSTARCEAIGLSSWPMR
jgi:MtN3 and saliva related transmembrane protein